MKRLVGLETEYGLYIDGVDVSDLAEEARALVQCIPSQAVWDYGDESPLRDVRGFRASSLTTNPDDDEVEKKSSGYRPRSAGENHVDRVLPNGARFYHDHGHPEYSTPECFSVQDLVTHDRAGESILRRAGQTYTQQTGRVASIYKNNTDFHGMSYGQHENYLISREMPFEQLVYGLLPFFVTRILFTGAGKVGVERASGRSEIFYQLSQRAEFLDTIMGVDTLHRRPLVNTRDEPHANSARWRRLHVICGDANLCEYSTALKAGTTALVLDVLERGYGAPVELKDPVQAIREISFDQEWRWIVKVADNTTIPALDIQRAYWLAASELFAGRDEETDWLLREWSQVLSDLEEDPLKLKDRLDWVAKHDLLESFLEAEDLDWQKNLDLLRSLDLEYHNLDLQNGLFWPLEESKSMRRITQNGAIEHAIEFPPSNTRALIRGLCTQRLDVKAANWGRLTLGSGGGAVSIDLRNIADVDLTPFSNQILNVSSPKDVLELLGEIEKQSGSQGGASDARAQDKTQE
ncbi:proteasome accessory factor PafA2 family protein [Candidatus Acetothermia bacterium]|nr:proteasome accessory factor PafA2 family protein [Candidatus Acetothermia bacterium]MBI3643829.1 proteasome accessory factor PafA2 family protein [Candidatus Acetothermia bacterium]